MGGVDYLYYCTRTQPIDTRTPSTGNNNNKLLSEVSSYFVVSSAGVLVSSFLHCSGFGKIEIYYCLQVLSIVIRSKETEASQGQPGSNIRFLKRKAASTAVAESTYTILWGERKRDLSARATDDVLAIIEK